MPVMPRPPLPKSALRIAEVTLTWCGAIAFPWILYVTMRGSREGFSVPLLLAAVALTAYFAGRLRHRPLPALAVLLAGGLAGSAARSMTELGLLQVLVGDLAVGYVAATRPRRTSLTAVAMALGTQVVIALDHRAWTGPHVETLAFLVVALAAAWTAGDATRERRVHTEALHAQATAQAVTAERLRIARELHDMIAHSIGVVAIQAGVGRRVIDTQPDEARKALAAIEATSQETLAGLGRTLGALRRADSGRAPDAAPREPTPGLDRDGIERLVESARGTGIRVDLRWRGERRTLPADIELAAYRIIQESLTNVVRHAGTADCHVAVDYRLDELSVEVEDRGRGGLASGPARGTGYGVVGMRERVALLRGRFTAGPLPEGGFRVTARLPLPEGAPLS
ncbi:sensor histidine kinase [Streptomyces sp. NBC_00234]|uniref:sensor histidine kinase n=1 Tax=Streptomyces sp. NBC_00234 TaxID=2903638 RepID=UPI002E2AAB63|nr:sensor histidine kinase [Streptomyces sp. NBC_00234]